MTLQQIWPEWCYIWLTKAQILGSLVLMFQDMFCQQIPFPFLKSQRHGKWPNFVTGNKERPLVFQDIPKSSFTKWSQSCWKKWWKKCPNKKNCGKSGSFHTSCTHHWFIRGVVGSIGSWVMSSLMRSHLLVKTIIEGSLNSKLPTIWRVEKQMKSREMK